MQEVLEALAPRYRFLERLAEGAQGVVVRAWQLALDREVVLKLLRLSSSQDARRRFQREARFLAELRSPFVVSLLDYGLLEETAYMAYEFLPGKPLDTILERRGQLPPGEVRDLLADVLAGLTEAHEAGMVHRDLKPGNLLRVEGRGYLLLDFGIASGGEEHTRLTRTGTFLGSPGYAAPDQIEGAEVDPRDDLYSLGVIAYEALTGANPFRTEALYGTLMRHVEWDPPPLATVLPGIEPSLASLVEGFLAKPREQRPASAGEALATLRGEGGISSEPGEEVGAPPLRELFLQSLVQGKGRWLGALLALSLGVGLGWRQGAGVGAPGPGGTPGPALSVSPRPDPPRSPEPLQPEALGDVFRVVGDAWLEESREGAVDPFRWEIRLRGTPGVFEFLHVLSEQGVRPDLGDEIRERISGLDRDLQALGAPSLVGPLLEPGPGEPTPEEDFWCLRARRAELRARGVLRELEEAILAGERANLPPPLHSDTLRSLVVRGDTRNPSRHLLSVLAAEPRSRAQLEPWLRPLSAAFREYLMALGRAAALEEPGTRMLLVEHLADETDWAPAMLAAWPRLSAPIALGSHHDGVLWRTLEAWLWTNVERIEGTSARHSRDSLRKARRLWTRLLHRLEGAPLGDPLHAMALLQTAGLEEGSAGDDRLRRRFQEEAFRLRGLDPELRFRIDLRRLKVAEWPQDPEDPLVQEVVRRWGRGYPTGGRPGDRRRLQLLLESQGAAGGEP